MEHSVSGGKAIPPDTFDQYNLHNCADDDRPKERVAIALASDHGGH